MTVKYVFYHLKTVKLRILPVGKIRAISPRRERPFGNAATCKQCHWDRYARMYCTQTYKKPLIKSIYYTYILVIRLHQTLRNPIIKSNPNYPREVQIFFLLSSLS